MRRFLLIVIASLVVAAFASVPASATSTGTPGQPSQSCGTGPGQRASEEEETTVAINGEYHETGYFQPVPPGAEVFFIPRIEGG